MDGAERLKSECNRTIKIVMHEVEEAEVAKRVHPYESDARRKRIMKALWTLFREALGYVPEPVERD